MPEEQLAKDPWAGQTIERIWLNINNLEGDKDKLKVALEINGVERVLFNTWISEGNHGQSHNLTWVLDDYISKLSTAIDALKYIANSVPGPEQQFELENKTAAQEALNKLDRNV